MESTVSFTKKSDVRVSVTHAAEYYEPQLLYELPTQDERPSRCP